MSSYGQTEVASVTGSEIVEAGSATARSAAFVRLADEHLDDSYRLAHAILGTRTDAEDATHDALVQAWRNWPQLRDHLLFEPWFHRILVNTCRDRLRTASKWHIQDLLAEVASVATADQVDAVDDREQIRAPCPACRPTTGSRSPSATTSISRSTRSPSESACPPGRSSPAFTRRSVKCA